MLECLHRPIMPDAFLADTVDITVDYIVVEHLHCDWIARSVSQLRYTCAADM